MSRWSKDFRLIPLARAAAAAGLSSAALGALEVRLVITPDTERAATIDRHARRWARGILAVAGVELHVSPAAPTAARHARLVVANHRSALDIPILLALFGGHVLSRADLAGWPILGRGARHLGAIFVDRADKESGARAIRAMRARLRRGRTVVAFPEGTTFAGDEVRAFRAGAFAAAKGLAVEVVPVGLAYPPHAEWCGAPFGEHLETVTASRRTRVAVAVGAPYPAAGPTAGLAETSTARVQSLVAHARRTLDGGGE